MEYSPPPLFKQGASARLKVIVFAIIALVLLAVDSRVQSLATIRHAVAVALYPLQMAALMPRDAAYAVGKYFYTLSSVQRENEQLRSMHLTNARNLQERELLMSENAHLRQLLGAAQRLPVKSTMADILYDTRDPFTRRIVLDRGFQHDVKPGQPVIDNVGVIGQVTRVFPLTSEVTLLTDKAQAIPVQVVRNGLRSLAYGRGQSNLLDLRYVPVNADIVKGDLLVTSGIDGVYPAGLAVARVISVESEFSDAFARIVCVPLAGVDRNRQLLILQAGLPAAKDAAQQSTTAAAVNAATGQASAAAATAAAPAAAGTKAAPAKASPAKAATKPGSAAAAAKATSTKPAAAKASAAKGTPAAPASNPAQAVVPAASIKPTSAPVSPTPAASVAAKSEPRSAPAKSAAPVTSSEPKATEAR